jgi:hypothetical protein
MLLLPPLMLLLPPLMLLLLLLLATAWLLPFCTMLGCCLQLTCSALRFLDDSVILLEEKKYLLLII